MFILISNFKQVLGKLCFTLRLFNFYYTHQGNLQRGEKIESSEFGKIQRSSVIDIIILIYELYVYANNDCCSK